MRFLWKLFDKLEDACLWMAGKCGEVSLFFASRACNHRVPRENHYFLISDGRFLKAVICSECKTILHKEFLQNESPEENAKKDSQARTSGLN